MIKKIYTGLFIIFSLVLTAIFNPAHADPHWDKQEISVYIPDDTKASSMKRAFEAWQSECRGNLTFKFTTEAPADIDVVFVDKTDGSDGKIGQYKINIKDGYITKAEIKIASKSSNNYSNNMIYTTMLHEIGHALGLEHSTRVDKSIMYMPTDEKQEIIKPDLVQLYKLYGWSWNKRLIQ